MIPQRNNKKHTPKRASTATLLAFTVVALVSGWVATPVGLRVESGTGLTWLFQWRGPLPAPDELVVLALTPDSGKALGLPSDLTRWPRRVHAQVIGALHQLGARAIGVDVFFREARDADDDAALADAIRRAGNVVLFAHLEREYLPEPHSGTLDRLILPLPPLARAAAATAPFFLTRYPDDVVFFPLSLPADIRVPTLPVAVWQISHPQQAEAFLWHGVRAPVAWYNFYGPPRTLHTLPIQDFLLATQDYKDLIRGATVFMGFSSRRQAGQRDEFRTAFSADSGLDISGVELAATAYANLRDRQGLHVPHPALRALWTAGWCLALMAALWFGKRYQVVITAVFLAALWGVSQALFSSQLVWMPVASLVVILPLLCLLAYRRHYEVVQGQKRLLEAAFGHYLPQSEIKVITERGGIIPNGNQLQAICLVTDARGYTALAEGMDVTHLGELMREYYEALIPPLRAHDALISDVTGDGLIALWPRGVNQAPPPCLEGLQALQQSVATFNHDHPKTPLPTAAALHSGDVLLGHFGAGDAHEFRAIGDLVNTTARLEGLTKQLGVDQVISEECLRALGEKPTQWRYLGHFLLVGRKQPVAVYTSASGHEPDSCIASLKDYLEAHDIQQTLTWLTDVVAQYPEDGPLRFYQDYLLDALSTQKSSGELLPVRLTNK